MRVLRSALMVSAANIAGHVAVADPTAGDQRMLLHGVSWKDYVILRELLDRPGLRMTYLRGALELMSPSRTHELHKKNIARVLELYAHVAGLDLYGYGSTTFKNEAAARGLEPDECYVVGAPLGEVPHLAIEVVHTTPLLDKLAVYAGLGVREVWVFRDGAFTVFILSAETASYAPADRSAILPALDLSMIARYAVREDTPQALRELEAELRRTS